jgi:hypothetical protein
MLSRQQQSLKDRTRPFRLQPHREAFGVLSFARRFLQLELLPNLSVADDLVFGGGQFG